MSVEALNKRLSARCANCEHPLRQHMGTAGAVPCTGAVGGCSSNIACGCVAFKVWSSAMTRGAVWILAVWLAGVVCGVGLARW